MLSSASAISSASTISSASAYLDNPPHVMHGNSITVPPNYFMMSQGKYYKHIKGLWFFDS